MLDSIKEFAADVATTAKNHPVLFGVAVLLIPIALGGLVAKIVSGIRRAPGGAIVADALDAAAKAAGSK
jgi:hypothetical protein